MHEPSQTWRAPPKKDEKKKIHRTTMYVEIAREMQEEMGKEKIAKMAQRSALVQGDMSSHSLESERQPTGLSRTTTDRSRSTLCDPLAPPNPSASPSSPGSFSPLVPVAPEQRTLSFGNGRVDRGIITNRIRSWGLVEDRSYDTHASRFESSPQRAIDMSMWAEGNKFTLSQKDAWYDAEYTVRARNFFRGQIGWQIVSMVAILIALFLADLFVIVQVPSNLEQDILMSIVSLLFFIEFVALSMADQEYPRSYFFWVDLAVLLSLSFDVSYLCGQDATTAEVFIGRDDAVAIHMAHFAKSSLRVGRVCRVLKIVRFASDNLLSEGEHTNMAHAISDQVTDAITKRVAFITTSLAFTLPVFFMYGWPEVDESIATWSQLLSRDFDLYVHANMTNDTTLLPESRLWLLEDFHLLSNFYKYIDYGPYKVCHRGDAMSHFKCHAEYAEYFQLNIAMPFKEPRRTSSSWLYAKGDLQCFFNYEKVKEGEAIVNILYLCFILLIMVFFGILLKVAVDWIALQPLDNMLSQVRERSQEIFRLATELQPGQKNKEEERITTATQAETLVQQAGEDNEFILLEKAFSKFSALANLSNIIGDEEDLDDPDDIDQNDVMLRNLRGLRSDNPADRETLIKYRASRFSSVEGSYKVSEDDEEHEQDRLAWFTFKLPSQTLEDLQDWNFDAFDLGKPTISLVASYVLFTGCRDWVEHNVPQNTLLKFVPLVESHYLANPFHNFAHATDVCFSVSYYSKFVRSVTILGELTQFWLLVAAIGHDIGHVGVNNGFLVETSHQFALTYNDRSPLENMHCASLFQLLALPEVNVFAALDKAIAKEARKGMISAILHTDIVQHGRLVRDFSLLYQMNQKTIDQQHTDFIDLLMSSSNHQLVANMLLHCCDVGNPMKPWKLCLKIAEMVMEEYFNQGDREKEADMPVQMLNDRNKVNKPNSQIGFIEFLIAPMVETFVKVFPGIHFLSENLVNNLETWLSVWIHESQPDEEEIEKTKSRVENVVKTLNVSF